MCRSCDIWFENGYISVNSSGVVVCIDDNQTDKVITGDLLNEFAHIRGENAHIGTKKVNSISTGISHIMDSILVKIFS